MSRLASAAGPPAHVGIDAHRALRPVVLARELPALLLANDLLEHVGEGDALLPGDTVHLDRHLAVLADRDVELWLGHVLLCQCPAWTRIWMDWSFCTDSSATR